MCRQYFFQAQKIQMQILTGQVNVAVRKRKTGGKVLTVRQLKDQGGVENLIQFDNGYRILKQLRGSPPYWESAQKDLMAMIRQLGPATLFMTLSAAETRWLHLLKLLAKIIDNRDLTEDMCEQLTWSEKCRLISSDPVTCSRHFQYSVNLFFKQFLKTPLSPFGKLTDYWYRCEFQMRGSPHLHMLIWIENAPQYGKDETADVIKYIDSIICCRRNWQNEEIDALTNLQIHKHTKSCKKHIRKNTVCRFGFPKFPMNETEILQPLLCDPSEQKQYTDNLNRIKTALAELKTADENLTMCEFLQSVNLTYEEYILAIRSSIKSDTLFLKRSPNELRVNNYNLDSLRAWRANIDVQFILDVYACAAYITSYVAKTSRGMSELLQKACHEAKHGATNFKQQLRQIGNKFLNNVEISAQEAVYILLQMPLKYSSRQVIFINTAVPTDRVYLLRNDLAQLPDNAYISANNLIRRYTKRSKNIETVTLADYAAWYDTSNIGEYDLHDDDNPDDNKDELYEGTKNTPSKRKHSRVIRFVRFTKDDIENYCREKLMLYTHWRNEDTDLYGGFATYEQHYNSIRDKIIQQTNIYEPFIDALESAESDLAASAAEEQWNLLAPGAQQSELDAQNKGTTVAQEFALIHPDSHGQTGTYDIGIDMGLAGTTTDQILNRYDMPDCEYYSLMRSLNPEQLQFLYDTVYLLKSTHEPIYRFLSGGAGTGKSYVLRALRETMERYYKSRCGTDFTQQSCMTIAPTGKAAFLAGGNTIHSVMHVPANQSLQYHRLDHDTLNTVRNQIGNIKLWFIDEISMCGNRLFSFIDQRLQEVHNSCKPFGGSSVVVFGDLFQLPPVMDNFIFENMAQTFDSDDYSVLAPNLWQQYFTMYELTTIMRQQNCLPYAHLLNRLREGQHTSEDLNVLRSRIFTPDNPSYPINAQHLFRTNSSVDAHNSHIFTMSVCSKYTIKAIDTVVGAISDDTCSHILNMVPDDSRKTMQLPTVIHVVIEGRYELSVNFNVADGLANGAGATVKRVCLFGSGEQASGIIWLQFDDEKVGLQTRAENRHLYTADTHVKWTPILPVSRQFQVGRSKSNQVMRKQFPLRHSAAKTIHRSQGDTLDQVVVDFSTNRKDAHTHYVGLSRVRSLDGLFILNLCEQKIHTSDTVKNEMTQLRTNRKLNFTLQFPDILGSTALRIAFLNIRSLHKHIDDLKCDTSLIACDMCFFCETRLMLSDVQSTNSYNLPTFNLHVFEGMSSEHQRSPYGIALYTRIPLKTSFTPASMTPSQTEVECTVIQVNLREDILLNVACIYRRPSKTLTHFTKAIQHLLSELKNLESQNPHVKHFNLFIGDFNLDWMESSVRKFMEKLLPNYLQLVESITTDYGTVLDHAYTNLPTTAIHVSTTESYFSDHKPIICTIQL